MGELNINPKKFPVGSVVYYVEKHGHEWSVSYGTVKDHYCDTICVQLYEPFDARLINGIPIKQFETPTRWSKLPKGWTYNTKLFSVDWAESKTNPNDYDIKNPDDILRAIADGVIVKVQDNDHAEIQTEIDNKMGWRITRKYPLYKHLLTYLSIRWFEVYSSFSEAESVVKSHDAEFKRQSELSDYDWSVEQIDRELDRWANINSISDIEKEEYRNWILQLDKVEDVDIRIFGGSIQWKYCKNKRWMYIGI